ncbi:enoyl-CoA hydratase/isomerase family protein [Rhodovibrio salinarum]|uniref:Enoyl-CoA hydratase n=1 Tax=Rhodovibrio salinarum TaxID=1087 RepID=A0A934QJK8_9PROT|nr:enoyl-CoA hydratase-related protein [Rhodovibrio salinarum]MBK1698058.1 enoyl-CoA hydratase [Rhodovibrio salinarum]
MADEILLTHEDAIATVTLNRPERRNACNLAMWRELHRVMTEVSADDNLRCIVVRGAGAEAFGAGADMSEFEAERFSAEQARSYNAVMAPAIYALRDCPHPTVALVQGACMGGGLEMALFCDLRIAGDGAKFGIPINRIGHGLPLPELSELVSLVGRPAALELLLEGRIWAADQARERGLVTRVVPDTEVEDEAYATAARIAKGAPIAARLHKRMARRVAQPEALTADELDAPFQTCDTADYKTGVRAFLNKEKPNFRGA